MLKRKKWKWLSHLFLLIFFLSCKTSDRPKAYEDPFYLYRLGVLHLNEGHLNEAEKCFLESIKLDPKSTAALNALGLTYLSMGKYEDAKIYFEKAISVTPFFSDAYNNLGVTYMQMGKYEKAEECFHKARQDSIYVLMPSLWFNLGLLREKQERYDEAIAFYSEAIRKKENYPIAYLRRGIIFEKLGKYEDALKDLRKYNELVKDEPEGLYHLGKCLVSLKNIEEAKVHLEKAYFLGPLTESGKLAKKLLEILP